MKADDSYRVTALRGHLLLAVAEVQKEIANTPKGDPPEAGLILFGAIIGLGVADAILKGETAEQALDRVMDKVEAALEKFAGQPGEEKNSG